MIALSCLDDEELLRHARNESDSLITSDLERELVQRFGDLIDRADDAPSEDLLAEHCGWADEALAQFPEEDFLESVIEDCMELQTQTTGARTKESLQEIIEKLTDIQKAIAGQTEYGREQLKHITG